MFLSDVKPGQKFYYNDTRYMMMENKFDVLDYVFGDIEVLELKTSLCVRLKEDAIVDTEED